MFGSHIRAYGQQLGLLPDLFILGLCILSSFPLTALYVLIPTTPAFRTTRHWFSIIATSTIALLVFDEYSILHLLGSTLATYFVTLWLGDRWWTPYVVFTATLAHLSWIHMGAQFWYIDSPDFVDISAPMMVLVIKLSSYAWSVYDGTRPDQELHSEMRPFAIKQVPSLVEYLGFVFFFATFWVGPAFDYQHYYEFSRNIGVYRTIPSSFVAGIKAVVLGILLLVAFLVLDVHWGPTYFRTGSQFITEPSLFWRIFLIQVAGFSTRAKLSSAWKISEAAGIFTGIGYAGINPETQAPIFNRLENVNLWKVELGQSPKGIVDGWNIKTSTWLKRCVYLRVSTPGSRPTELATGLTNLVSAMWHGFHAGYYMSFLSATLWIIVGRTTRRYFRPFVTLPESSLRAYKPLYDTIGFIVSMSTLNYIFIPFIVWRADASLSIWSSVFFLGHVVLGTTILLLDTLGVGRYLLRYWLPKFVGADAAASARGEAVVECEETQASRGSMAKVAGVTKPSTKYKKA
ncbi:hypothetical protein BASA61_009657 [Batrachochytrium salamandrivorans]|nr:hypothetical protein BASA61_009657 [Batrachochytrium salamandrivorans]